MPLKPLKENATQADIIEWIKESTTQFDIIEKAATEKETEINKLKEDNQRLFIQAQATTVVTLDKDKQDTKELEEYIGKDVLKVLSTKEIEKAKYIMEGEDE